ncbi:hypothetical protein HMI56_002462 [Coelomomyces lativittatus]|nr:hypothetical protein HMI56_002462 [Coelomomyces lativittatus]
MFPETEPLAFQEQPSAMTSLFHSDPVADSASILYSFPSNFHSANDSKHRASHFNFINKLPTLPSPETKFYHHTNSLGYESLLTPEKTPSSQNIYISDSDDSDNSDNSQLSVSTDEKENGFEEEMNVEASRGNFKEFHLNGDDFNTPFSSKESQKEREMVSLLPFESFMQFSQTSSNSTRRPRTSKLFLPSVNSNEKILSPIPSATLPSSMDNEALKQHIKSLITRQSVLYPKSPQDSIYSKPQVFSESPSFQPNSLNQEKIPKSPKSYMTARSLSPTVPSLASPSLENGSVSEIFSHYAAFFANMEVHPPETLRSTELASMLLQLENQLAYTLSQFKSNSSLQAVMIAFFMLIQSERKKMQASKKP